MSLPGDPEDESRGEVDWERSERRSFWIALLIALAPIPAALLISWVLGSPPWLEPPAPDAVVVPADVAHPHR